MLRSGPMSTAIKTILVGYDGFERKEPLPALASALAQEHGARLHVVHVSPEPPSQSWWSRDARALEAHAAHMERRRKRLEELVAGPRKRGIEVQTLIRQGVPHVELVREAMAVSADLLIVTDELLHRKGNRGFGSVTTKLLRYCPIPVLAKRDIRKFKHREIVASLDLDPTTLEPGLNEAILAMAAALARRAEPRITVFHAWALWGEHLLSGRNRINPDDVRAWQDEAKREREQEAKRLLASSDLEGIEVSVEMHKGDPRRLLPEFVEKNKVDIVVMGTVGRTGLQGVIIGNTAERILNELSCSVLAVKPKGFASPIKPADD